LGRVLPGSSAAHNRGRGGAAPRRCHAPHPLPQCPAALLRTTPSRCVAAYRPMMRAWRVPARRWPD